MATLFFGGLAAVVFRLTRRRAPRFAVILVAVVPIAGVSVSRICLELHWVTDVLGGILLGLFGVTLGVVATEWLVGRSGGASPPPGRPSR
jgi:membrane-associated phospholipid phosphatase